MVHPTSMGRHISHLAQDVRRSVASAHGHGDAVPALHVLIQEEKDVVMAFRDVGRERTEAGKFMTNWAKADAEVDLIDVTEKLETLAVKFGEIQNQMAGK
ncbi:hypothetical protein HK104_008393 [Borealophlyctis nickersoniae]|nr:hypothetical protein HK104_008393 [Borealophlyctis nickersoniae]